MTRPETMLTGGADIDRADYTGCDTAVTVTIDGTNNDGGTCGNGSAATTTCIQTSSRSPAATLPPTRSRVAAPPTRSPATRAPPTARGAADTINGDPAACAAQRRRLPRRRRGQRLVQLRRDAAPRRLRHRHLRRPLRGRRAPGITVTLDDVANDGRRLGQRTDNVNGDCERIIGNAQADTINATGRRPGACSCSAASETTS